ncbi:MAG TPA: sulfite exporter TauE/SafE family protein [Chitinophagaceae bacterium]|nr:sulfite exporter TauE/SafE family protein [Chitinophagaceae bacterium]
MTTQIILLIIIIGLFAGILSGLVGVGGGIILVPALVYFLNYSQHQAQGTSLGVLTFPVVIVAFLKYYYDTRKMGEPIDFKVIGLLAIGFVVGGFLGSSLALKIDKEALRKIFAIILFYTAFQMLKWDMVIVRFFKKIFS